MTVDELFVQFSDKMTQNHLYQRAMRHLATEELSRLTEYYETFKSNPRKLERRELNNMVFHDIQTGVIRYFNQVERSVQEQIRAVYLHKNKQYQWLLSEAYEVFEDLIEDLYAYLGWIDPQSWRMSDFGNISIKDVSTNDYNWYRQRVMEKRDKPDSLLNHFRQLFPDIEAIEKTNHFRINLRLSIKLIEMLRHVIVHKSGFVDSKSDFIDSVLKKAGLYQNGNPRPEHSRFVRAMFSKGDYENLILLLEIPVEDKQPMDAYIDKWDLLAGHMISYAEYLSRRIKRHEADIKQIV